MLSLSSSLTDSSSRKLFSKLVTWAVGSIPLVSICFSDSNLAMIFSRSDFKFWFTLPGDNADKFAIFSNSSFEISIILRKWVLLEYYYILTWNILSLVNKN